jgi:hypothetical protein
MCHTKRRNKLQAQKQTVTPPPWDYLPQATHKGRRNPAPAKNQQKHPVTASLKNTDPGHSAWGPRHIHRLTLLCQGLRYLKNRLGSTTSTQPSPRSPLHLVHQLKMSSAHGPSAPCRQHIDLAHLLCHCRQAIQITSHNATDREESM